MQREASGYTLSCGSLSSAIHKIGHSDQFIIRRCESFGWAIVFDGCLWVDIVSQMSYSIYMKVRTKKNKTSFRYDARYAELIDAVLDERGGNLSELIRLLLINEFIRCELMPPMTDEEKSIEARR